MKPSSEIYKVMPQKRENGMHPIEANRVKLLAHQTLNVFEPKNMLQNKSYHYEYNL